MTEYFTRMGDGFGVYMTEEDIRADIREGVLDAADRGQIPPLTEEETEHLYRIITMDGVIVGVRHGEEVVSSTDQGADTVGLRMRRADRPGDPGPAAGKSFWAGFHRLRFY